MPYSVTYDTETDCVLVSVEGELNLSLFDNMAAEAAQCLNEYGSGRILNDLRHAKPTKLAADIYNMPKHALKAGIAHTVKRALVVSKTFPEFHFLETVFINQGNIVQLFNSIDDAKRLSSFSINPHLVSN
jgi:hypothetical protein